MNLTVEQIAAKKRSLIKAIVVLSVFVLVGFVVMAFVAYGKNATAGLLAATLASAVCWTASIAALCLTYKTAGTPDGLSGVFGGMLMRTGIPMAFAIVGTTLVPELARVGLFGMTLLMFLLTLAVETWLAVGIVSASQKSGAAMAAVDDVATGEVIAK